MRIPENAAKAIQSELARRIKAAEKANGGPVFADPAYIYAQAIYKPNAIITVPVSEPESTPIPRHEQFDAILRRLTNDGLLRAR